MWRRRSHTSTLPPRCPETRYPPPGLTTRECGVYAGLQGPGCGDGMMVTRSQGGPMLHTLRVPDASPVMIYFPSGVKATAVTTLEWSRALTCARVVTFYTCTTVSPAANTMKCRSGVTAMQLHCDFTCPSTAVQAPVCRSQILGVLQRVPSCTWLEDTASTIEAPSTATDSKVSCGSPCSTAVHVPEASCQSRSVPSKPPDTTRSHHAVPPGSAARQCTSPVCPVHVAVQVKECRSHTLRVLSPLHDTAAMPPSSSTTAATNFL
mmetsp:Transcript_10519/g.22593  ORF Transcript_10519/g.22593 Transcript_10519/m.22593 type:complete len:264 (-) Transcript_10519:198-989(-)